ncbi:hypothetical protein H9L39_15376 [Fusarium oxysporum f. sp. albedinis]|nr:hypothetical protein H9L39_15376 [Fusarium oxysporum f. sp. albedinis]
MFQSTSCRSLHSRSRVTSFQTRALITRDKVAELPMSARQPWRAEGIGDAALRKLDLSPIRKHDDRRSG